MSQPARGQGRPARFTGVIDTLSAGYGVVNKQVWIILIPVLLDLFLWLGPQVSPSPLVARLLVEAEAVTLAPGGVESYEEFRRRSLEASDNLNLLSLVSANLAGVPTFVGMRGGIGPLQFVDNWTWFLGLAIGSSLVGTFLGCLYYGLLAQVVREGKVTASVLMARLWRHWLSVLGLSLLLLAAVLFGGVPASLLMHLLAGISPELASAAMMALIVLLLWVGVHLFFTGDAVFVGDQGPLGAVRGSMVLVQRHFGPALLLMGLIMLISLGMPLVWEALVQVADAWGTLLGIFGNAYISSGLAAAAMIFYLERGLGSGTRDRQA